MRSKLSEFIAGALLVAGIYSCSSKTIPGLATGKLEGSWEWISSSGGFAGTVRTPESTGEKRQIEFRGTRQLLFVNGEKVEERKIGFTQGESIFSQEKTLILRYENDAVPQSAGFRGRDTLVLRDEVYDGFSSTYVRRRR